MLRAILIIDNRGAIKYNYSLSGTNIEKYSSIAYALYKMSENVRMVGLNLSMGRYRPLVVTFRNIRIAMSIYPEYIIVALADPEDRKSLLLDFLNEIDMFLSSQEIFPSSEVFTRELSRIEPDITIILVKYMKLTLADNIIQLTREVGWMRSQDLATVMETMCMGGTVALHFEDIVPPMAEKKLVEYLSILFGISGKKKNKLYCVVDCERKRLITNISPHKLMVKMVRALVEHNKLVDFLKFVEILLSTVEKEKRYSHLNNPKEFTEILMRGVTQKFNSMAEDLFLLAAEIGKNIGLLSPEEYERVVSMIKEGLFMLSV